MTRRRRGASALEFALVAPVLLLSIFGVLDWSWFMYRRVPVILAAERGARAAAGVRVDQNPEGAATAAAEEWLTRYGMASGAVVTAVLTVEGGGNVVEVRVEVPSRPLVGVVGVPATITSEASSDWYGDVGGA
jgi:Flp pilus assembly protein TadG